jgi:hypothetical protein
MKAAKAARSSSFSPTKTRSRWKMRSANALKTRRIPASSAALASHGYERSRNRQPAHCPFHHHSLRRRDPDTHVIKSVLAITNNPNRREAPYHIVTQIRDPQKYGCGEMLGIKIMFSPSSPQTSSPASSHRLHVRAALSIVYTELMNFGGDEIYFKQEPNLSARPMAKHCSPLKPPR